MSSFYTQSVRLSSSLLGKRNTPATSFNLQEHLRNQFSRSHQSTAVHSDESRKTSYDHREDEHLKGSLLSAPVPIASQLQSTMNNNRI